MRRYHNNDKLRQAARVLGLSRTRDGDLRPMVHALKLFPAMNTAEENARLDAAVYAMRHWREYQNLCGRVRSNRESL
ncbi:hypothetical protein Cp1R7AA1_012 [Mesorhizobium phage Cp1R7A-A1]|nr:hypothetical protein Cp1R7AA1_012 [Mesorhizobium phage Cp1R7A-A1]